MKSMLLSIYSFNIVCSGHELSATIKESLCGIIFLLFTFEEEKIKYITAIAQKITDQNQEIELAEI